MATLTKPELIEALQKMGVELTGQETVADLKELIAKNSNETTPRGEGVTLEQADAQAVADGSKVITNGVRFHLHNIVTKHRDFTPAEHGENWQEVAAEFEKNNAKKIRSKQDL